MSRTLIRGIAVVALLTLAVRFNVAADDKPGKKDADAAKPDAPRELVVWSGDAPAGLTWAKLGPKGTIDVAEKAGVGKSGKGLELSFDGDGWRGCGVNWKGWYPPEACDNVAKFNTLVFQIRQISKSPEASIRVTLVDNIKRSGGEPVGNLVDLVSSGAVEKIDGTWRRVVIPLQKFTAKKPLQLGRLWGIDFSNQGGGNLTFQIDQIGFSVDPSIPAPPPPDPFSARVTVATGKELHSIKEGIYGVASLRREKLVKYGIKITRWGGNPSTRYNWKLNVDNGASDWFFKNRGQPIQNLNQSGYLKHIRGNQSFGATTYQTVPMIGWVAKDASSYSFSVARFGAQKGSEPGQPDVGNGVRSDGKNVTGNDPRDTSQPAPPEFIEEAVRFVVSKAGPAEGDTNKPGVKYWVLDNEPALWNSTHRDVHPKPLSYDELWERTVQYAEAIRRADPSAKIAGYCSWGWMDLFYSALDAGTDNFGTKADWQAHGKVPMAEWFLKKCAAYRQKTGKPLLDVFDVHWYPQGQMNGQGVYQGKGFDPQLCALRLRSTRELWDPDYKSESWIANSGMGTVVALIPRIRNWIAEHNPGMEFCVGEYNFGGADNISGALAQADALGIFARENLDLAFLWHAPEGTLELGWQLFRDYDGKASRFGDLSLAANSNQSDLAVHAARRTADQALTIVLINKNLEAACNAEIDLETTRGKLQGWRFDSESEGKIVAVEKLPANAGGLLKLALPAASATILVVTP